ncbi:adenylosuccinate synthase [Thermosipho atlanticus]|uniref:Adenylosuccinate synthetase n=1 Tax=Thermosipho atlanticus DSM 15807 TaxID=1123380 RepID=A0A1M5QPE1_9BACT|nr:adenylosuccinate synthase [Thermosipho atlanticus]SHH15987.1 Adenylosuccinate synthetase [Thermosipho atlanticus DSM 15807]
MKIVIVGLQWGDEGKGKVVAYFSQFFDNVVRFSGGSNAGHTIEYNEGIKIVNHLLPSFYNGKQLNLIISNGVLVDLETLVEEIEELKNKIDYLPEIKISNLAHVVLPFHKVLDEKIDEETHIGTTKRGIGPAYADKINRIGIRLKDFENKDNLMKKLRNISEFYYKMYGINLTLNYKYIIELYEKIKRYIVSQMEIIEEIKESNVLFEGTQGVLLDLDMGTYPYVTGTNCNTTGVQSGVGYPVKIDKYLGVFKAYLTRVGNGPFPTEIYGEEAAMLREKGKEFGATTGRPRRVGWLDLILLKYAIKVSGVEELVLTKGDILSKITKIPVCIGYKIGSKVKENITSIDEIKEVTPVYTYLDGWETLNDLNFKRFLEFIENFVDVKIKYVSYGPKVDQIKQIRQN